jgi:hypothetical protein
MDAVRVDAERNSYNVQNNLTLEENAIKKVVRENWESKLKEKGTNLEILSRHAEFMTREFGSIGYETMCMQNIVSHTKHMSNAELLAYTRLVEALAIGYKSKFGWDFGGLLIAGATSVSKDLHSMRKHFDYLVSYLSQNSEGFDKAIEREMKNTEMLNSELMKKNSGIFRFLRKKDILFLKRRIKVRQARIGRFQVKKEKYRTLTDMVKARASQSYHTKQV